MSTTLGIVEVPPHSLPPLRRPSDASRIFAGKSLLEWVIRRVTDSLLLEQVVVVGPASQAQRIRQLAPPDVSVFIGPETDALGRLAAAARALDAEQLVRVQLSCPFVDPDLIDRLLGDAKTHPGFDYIGYCDSSGVPAVQSQLGILAEWCRGEAIERADREASLAAEREQSTRFLYSHPEWFQLRLLPVPRPLDRKDLRLRLGVEEDWDHLQSILEALGPDSLDWHAIAELLEQQPAMRQRMALMNQAEKACV